MSPHDWSPRGWRVDQEELAFIREAHKVQARRVMLEEVESFGLDWEKGRGTRIRATWEYVSSVEVGNRGWWVYM